MIYHFIIPIKSLSSYSISISTDELNEDEGIVTQTDLR